MGDGSLSQEEIDALLMGADDMGSSDPMGGMGSDMGSFGGDAGGGGGISPSERELIADAFNEAMQNASSPLSSLIGKTVNISNPVVEEVTGGIRDIPANAVVVEINMGSAKSALVFPDAQAKAIASSMMGAGGAAVEMDEAHLSTIGELSNTLLGSFANHLRDRFKDDLNPSPPTTRVFSGQAPSFPGDKAVKISYTFNMEGAPAGRIFHYIDAGKAAKWAKTSGKPAAGGGGMDFDFGGGGGGGMGGGMDLGGKSGGVPINPVSFPSLQQSSIPSQVPPNLELLLDVQMVLTVELGRTRKYVKDILSLGEGSIIELDKLAGEPVDLLINGKLIAKGEVVVIDENFGVRVTDIVGPAERLGAVNSGGGF